MKARAIKIDTQRDTVSFGTALTWTLAVFCLIFNRLLKNLLLNVVLFIL